MASIRLLTILGSGEEFCRLAEQIMASAGQKWVIKPQTSPLTTQ